MSEVLNVVKRCLSYGDDLDWCVYSQETDGIGEYISALSNAAALTGEPYGYMIWGVDTKTHEIVGTTYEGQDKESLNKNVFPAIQLRFDEDEINGKRVVVLFIPAAKIAPTAYNGVKFVRISESNENISKYPDREAALFYVLHQHQKTTDTWEKRKSKYRIKDINKNQFAQYLKKAKDAGRIAINSDDPKAILNLLEVADNDILLNAGAAIFVDSGINELEMVQFKNDDRQKAFNLDRKTGSILDLADKAVQYISKAITWHSVSDENTEKKEIPEIPIPAIREAVINAFAHRVIESRQPVDVSVYKSYIDIYSPGVFPEDIEPEEFIREMKKPRPRNPLSTQTLYYSKDMETFATGLKRISTACNEAGVKYEFIRETFGFTVRLYRNGEEEWKQAIVQEPPFVPDEPKERLKTSETPEIQENKDIEFQDRLTAILEKLEENPRLSRERLAQELNLSRHKVRSALDKLKQDGIIHYGHIDGHGQWIID